MTGDYPSVFFKAPHKKGCEGALYNNTLHGRKQIVHVDRTGRIGNGGIVCHEYICNRNWDDCKARVLVPERSVRLLAVAAEVRR